LSCGGKVVLAENALQLPDLLAASEVTLVNTVPSAMAELMRMRGVPASVRAVNLAGEPLPTRLVNDIYEQKTIERVFDLYGPSESTTYSTFALRRAKAPATIGRPISNTQVYLLDSQMHPAPVGVSGQLYIGGEGLGRCYLDRPELTGEKWVPNPFSESPGERLYKTGDLGRWRADGTIEFLGRNDFQVKIRGYRSELEEIESQSAA
jgi:non-ribosomal peptide synthetase component F